MSAQTAIVIGGGIAGCATAYALATRGIKVTLIERHDALAMEASGNPFAVLYPRLTGQNTALEALNIHGYLHTLKWINAIDVEHPHYQACGVIQLAINEKLRTQHANLAKAYQNNELQFLHLEAEQLSAISGIAVQHSGLYFAQAGGVNLADLCNVLAAHPNITTLTNTEALQLKQTAQSTWQVLTTNDSAYLAEADNIVIANANDAAKLDQTAHLPLIKSRGQLTFLKSDAVSEKLRTIVCGDGYITPAINYLHTLGATFSTQDEIMELRAADHESNLQLLKKTSATLYTLHKNVASGRVAWRCQTTDYLPAVGQLLDINALKKGKYFYNDAPEKLPWLTGLYVNVGHGAKGFLSAPLCSDIIASTITKDTDSLRSTLPASLLSGLQPSRFILRELGFKALAQSLTI